MSDFARGALITVSVAGLVALLFEGSGPTARRNPEESPKRLPAIYSRLATFQSRVKECEDKLNEFGTDMIFLDHELGLNRKALLDLSFDEKRISEHDTRRRVYHDEEKQKLLKEQSEILAKKAELSKLERDLTDARYFLSTVESSLRSSKLPLDPNDYREENDLRKNPSKSRKMESGLQAKIDSIDERIGLLEMRVRNLGKYLKAKKKRASKKA